MYRIVLGHNHEIYIGGVQVKIMTPLRRRTVSPVVGCKRVKFIKVFTKAVFVYSEITYVIFQRTEVFVAILIDLNLLPYQTAIIWWRNFNKDICTISTTHDIYKTLTLIKKFLYKFRIIIFFENPNLKTVNWADCKIYKG